MFREPFPAHIVKTLVSYDPENGGLEWLPRSSEMFQDAKRGKLRACSVWNSRYAGRPALYTINKDNRYLMGYILHHMMLAHRVIWAHVHGEWPNNFIDHINSDRADNRIDNLRVVTRSENSRNTKLHSGNTSGHIGVSWSKPCGKWRAYIKDGGGQIHLGVFDDKIDAIAARVSAQKRLGYHDLHGQK